MQRAGWVGTAVLSSIASEEAVMTSGQMPQYGVTISMPGNVNFIKTQRGCRGIEIEQPR